MILQSFTFQSVTHDMDQSYGMLGSVFRSGECFVFSRYSLANLLLIIMYRDVSLPFSPDFWEN